jgi:hypothetical protein
VEVRDAQYASLGFRDALGEYGITSSMSRKGNCWDNACSETPFGSLKVERLHGQRFKTRREAKEEIVAWLLWYNRLDFTRRWPTSARCNSSRTGLTINQGKPTHELSYGVWISGARSFGARALKARFQHLMVEDISAAY